MTADAQPLTQVDSSSRLHVKAGGATYPAPPPPRLSEGALVLKITAE